MQVIALLTRVTSQINQTWWGDCCASLKRIKSQSTSRTSLALTYSHPERTQGWRVGAQAEAGESINQCVDLSRVTVLDTGVGPGEK